MAHPVYFLPLAQTDSDPRLELGHSLARLGAAVAGNRQESSDGPWAVKVDVGAPGRPPAIDPMWLAAVAADLGPGAAFAFDTLSINDAALAETESHLALAATKGFAASRQALPYIVADGPAAGPPLIAALPADSELGQLSLAGGLGQASNLCVMTPIRPHPHLGLRGAVASLGLGLCDREGKLALHRDIRPQVDTPLCAGCGGCLAVCLVDAIVLRGGRAFIDHTRCNGCGECMNVCFMAGIAAEEAEGIGRFQTKVADAAFAARNAICGADRGRQLYLNFLVRLDREAGGARARQRDRLGDVGVLAATDPVAVDQATIDLIEKRSLGHLAAWSGFSQVPAEIMRRAAALGLGQRDYTLVNV